MQLQTSQEASTSYVGSDEDIEWQQGLQAILTPLYESGASQEEIADVTARARSFYEQAKSGPPVSTVPIADDVTVQDSTPHLSDLASSSSQFTPSTAAAEPPYPLSFSALAALIASGEPVPGIRDIPDKLNDATPSVSTVDVAKVRKPWEMSEDAQGGDSAPVKEGATNGLKS